MVWVARGGPVCPVAAAVWRRWPCWGPFLRHGGGPGQTRGSAAPWARRDQATMPHTPGPSLLGRHVGTKWCAAAAAGGWPGRLRRQWRCPGALPTRVQASAWLRCNEVTPGKGQDASWASLLLLLPLFVLGEARPGLANAVAMLGYPLPSAAWSGQGARLLQWAWRRRRGAA